MSPQRIPFHLPLVCVWHGEVLGMLLIEFSVDSAWPEDMEKVNNMWLGEWRFSSLISFEFYSLLHCFAPVCRDRWPIYFVSWWIELKINLGILRLVGDYYAFSHICLAHSFQLWCLGPSWEKTRGLPFYFSSWSVRSPFREEDWCVGTVAYW